MLGELVATGNPATIETLKNIQAELLGNALQSEEEPGQICLL
jgi:hypothetical protein